MLHQSANRGGQHLSIVGFSLASRLMAIEFSGSIDDGGHRDLDSFVLQAIS